jgi:hypothetical protein
MSLIKVGLCWKERMHGSQRNLESQSTCVPDFEASRLPIALEINREFFADQLSIFI